MFIDSTTLRRVNIYSAYKGFSKLDTPEIRQRAGVVEIPDPVPPEDYSDETYYRTEQDTDPYVIYTKKSDEQLAQLAKSKAFNKIDNLERTSMVPRAVREFMLAVALKEAVAAGLTEEQLVAVNPGYRKTKQLDAEIAALRDML